MHASFTNPFSFMTPGEELRTIVVMGTMDTKGRELAYLAGRVREAGCRALLMDVSAHANSDVSADIPADQVAAAGDDIARIRALPRGEAVGATGDAARQALPFLRARRCDPRRWNRER